MWLTKAQGSALTAYITFASGAGFALFGYDQGVFGALLGNESFIKTFDNPESVLQGHITATYDLGCFAGAIFTMCYGNKFGSRLIIMAGCSILIIGAILQTAAYHVPQLILGRLIAGVGNGMNTAVIPVWESEVVSAAHRGRTMVMQLALNQVGNVTAQWINYGMLYCSSNSVSWRFPLAFQCFFALLTMVFIPWLPDSPRWLMMKGRHQEAMQIIRRLGGGKRTEEEHTEAYDIIHQNVLYEMSLGKISARSLLKKDTLHTTRRILLGAGTQLMQQWSGINCIVYYLPVVFASLGLSRNLSVILSCCNAMNLLISTCFGALYIESFGRKKMMLWGAVAQSICFALVAAGLGVGGRQWDCVAVAFIFGYITTFGLSWIAVPWMYPAEINTQRMRIPGAGIATATNWINNYAVVLITPVGIQNLAWKYYLIYAALNASFVPIVQFFYVETARLSLEEIDQIFDKTIQGAPPSDQGKVSAVTDEEKEIQASHISI